jgi:serine/threonine protein kinase
VIFHSLLTGKYPFGISSMETDPLKLYNKIKKGPLLPPKQLSPFCHEILLRTLERDPSKRSTCQELYDRIVLHMSDTAEVASTTAATAIPPELPLPVSQQQQQRLPPIAEESSNSPNAKEAATTTTNCQEEVANTANTTNTITTAITTTGATDVSSPRNEGDENSANTNSNTSINNNINEPNTSCECSFVILTEIDFELVQIEEEQTQGQTAAPPKTSNCVIS